MMEEIQTNAECFTSVCSRPETNQNGSWSPDKRFYGALVACLGLLSLFLLVFLISLSVHHYEFKQRSAADLSAIKVSLTQHLQACKNSLTAMSNKLEIMDRTCTAEWILFGHKRILLSDEAGTWDEAREDCELREGHLVVIDSFDLQDFLSNYTQDPMQAWIGLTDRDHEGTWTWVNGDPLSLEYWQNRQPDNGRGDAKLGQEDCAHMLTGGNRLRNWNDLSCSTSMRWLCEKKH